MAIVDCCGQGLADLGNLIKSPELQYIDVAGPTVRVYLMRNAARRREAASYAISFDAAAPAPQ